MIIEKILKWKNNQHRDIYFNCDIESNIVITKSFNFFIFNVRCGFFMGLSTFIKSKLSNMHTLIKSISSYFLFSDNSLEYLQFSSSLFSSTVCKTNKLWSMLVLYDLETFSIIYYILFWIYSLSYEYSLLKFSLYSLYYSLFFS